MSLFIYSCHFCIDRDLQQLRRQSKLYVQLATKIASFISGFWNHPKPDRVIWWSQLSQSMPPLHHPMKCCSLWLGPWLSNIKAFSFRHPFTSQKEKSRKCNTRFLASEMQLLKLNPLYFTRYVLTNWDCPVVLLINKGILNSLWERNNVNNFLWSCSSTYTRKFTLHSAVIYEWVS